MILFQVKYQQVEANLSCEWDREKLRPFLRF